MGIRDVCTTFRRSVAARIANRLYRTTHLEGPSLRYHSSWALPYLYSKTTELTFWLFMLHQGPKKRDWFGSWEVRVWYIGECAQWNEILPHVLTDFFSFHIAGSLIAVLGMPLTAFITRNTLMQVRLKLYLLSSCTLSRSVVWCMDFSRWVHGSAGDHDMLPLHPCSFSQFSPPCQRRRRRTGSRYQINNIL